MSEKVFKIDEIGKEAVDFFVYSYFGIVNGKDSNEEMKKKCAQRAYLDLARTLEFNSALKKQKEKEEKDSKYVKQKFRDIICNQIIKRIDEQFLEHEFLSLADKELQEEFDRRHNIICNEIVTCASKMTFSKGENKPVFILSESLKKQEKIDRFYYGQAQKWLNMTLKYIWLLGIQEEQMGKLKNCLHVPVDSYIMEAAAGRCRKKGVTTEGVGILLKRNDGQYKEKYSEESVLPWSRWRGKENVEVKDDTKNNEYYKFQADLRQKLEDRGKSPIEWENEQWIAVAENRLPVEDKNVQEEIKIDCIYEGKGIK